MINFHCPRCRTPLRVHEERAGSSMACPGCEYPIRVPGTPPPPQHTAAPEKARQKLEPAVSEYVTDKMKEHCGTQATFLFLIAAPICIALQDGWRAIFSCWAVGFALIGMFVAAVLIGNAIYWPYYWVLKEKQQQINSGQLAMSEASAQMTPFHLLMNVLILVLTSLLAWFGWMLI